MTSNEKATNQNASAKRLAILLTAQLGLCLAPTASLAQGSGSIPIQFTSDTVGPGALGAPSSSNGERDIQIITPVGPINLRIGHVGPPSPNPNSAALENTFRPPALFSAPLPTGSGARALGLGGSFTAIADDATAASWNPAGLINLERAEASVVFRSSFTKTSHHSSNPDYEVGSDHFENISVNYLSITHPIYLEPIQRNMVFSLNIQEAYDFESHFQARSRESNSQNIDRSNRRQFSETQTDQFSFDGGRFDLQLTSTFTTDSETRLQQTINSTIETEIDFKQEGVIQAFTPAVALEISPKLSVGAALNYYFDSTLPGQKIESTTVSRYTMQSTRRSTITRRQTTTGTFQLDGNFNSAGIPPLIDPFSTPIPGVAGNYPSFSNQSRSTRSESFITEGVLTEKNEFKELEGINSTFGILWSVNNFLSLGASTDLAWTADARQKKTVYNQSETYTADRSQLINQSDTRTEEQRDVSFHFPLFWSAGMALRWSPHFYTAIDVSQTRWSDFAYEVEGEGKINPFNGEPYNENPLDDTWSVRIGSEYLRVTRRGEIPFRGGLIYEERPALGEPDQYLGFALGSGYAIDFKQRRLILDLAYHFLKGNNVQNVAPEQDGLSSDVLIQQLFLSGILHF